jgi:hypothetical protein
MRDEAAQISDAVPVGIGKGADKDLVANAGVQGASRWLREIRDLPSVRT